MPTAQDRKTAPPWETTDDITWKMAAEQAEGAMRGGGNLAQGAARAHDEMTPERRRRHLTEDLPQASEVVRRTKRKTTHLEDQIAVVARAIQHDIVTKREPSKMIRLSLRLSPEEKDFVTELLVLRGYECEWDHDAPKLDFTADHADNNGRFDQVLELWVPADSWHNGQGWEN